MQTSTLRRNQLNSPEIAFLVPVSATDLSILLIGDFAVIGRDPQASLSLNDPYVSSRHARIERSQNGYVIRDLQSRNGTYINEMRVSEAYLNCNDRIRVGESIFLFTDEPQMLADVRSKNGEWNEQLMRLHSFASSEFPVLITGPSGSGKEVMARTIHHLSSRTEGPFVAINCSALSESLIESELFGHTKGAFTGASGDRKGAFESARGGTLFLDEIGDLPMNLQPKILRALENSEIRPVGSDRTVQTDVRIISATHQQMQKQINSGKFREDLFYRLNVCRLQVPALIDRMEDFDDILLEFARNLRVEFSSEAQTELRIHSWPGNIRELRNAVARAAAYFPGITIQVEHIGRLIDPLRAMPAKPKTDVTRGSYLREVERKILVQKLTANNGNQRRTAMELGIPKSTLHDRLRSYQIDPMEFTVSRSDSGNKPFELVPPS